MNPLNDNILIVNDSDEGRESKADSVEVGLESSLFNNKDSLISHQNNIVRQSFHIEHIETQAYYHQSPVFISKIAAFNRPALCFILSILIAWIFVLIPNGNFWVYNFVRVEWWAILVAIAYCEIEYACLPDVSDRTYVFSYITAILSAPLLHLSSWIFQIEGSEIINTMAVASAVIPVIIIFGYDAYCQPRYGRTRSSSAPVCELFDVFNAVNGTDGLDTIIPQIKDDTTNVTEVEGELHSKWSNIIKNRITKRNKQLTEAQLQSLAVPIWNEDNITDYITSKFMFILPRHLYRKLDIDSGHISGDRRWLWACASAFNILWIVYYTFLQYFTVYYRNHANSPESYRIILFLIFIIIGSIIRMMMKRLCMEADRSKQDTLSMFYIGELLCLFFYFTFYRVLFESVTTWSEFLTFQIMHLSAEWLLYPLRASVEFYTLMKRISERTDSLRWIGLWMNSTGLSHKDWMSFVSLDFGIRLVVLLSSAVGIILLLLSIQYIPWVSNSLKEDPIGLEKTIYYIALAVALELINVFAMNYLFFQRNGIKDLTSAYAKKKTNPPLLIKENGTLILEGNNTQEKLFKLFFKRKIGLLPSRPLAWPFTRNICICIIIVDELIHEDIWRFWLEDVKKHSSSSRAILKIHAKYPENIKSEWVKQFLIPISFNPEWNSPEVIRAMIALLKYSLDDQLFCERFVFATESCIPIYSINEMTELIFTNDENKDKSWLNAYNIPNDNWEAGACFYSVDTNRIPIKAVWKSLPGWIMLTRKHSIEIVNLIDIINDDIISAWGPGGGWSEAKGGVFAPEEMFFATML
eukprot:gene15105-20323_t